MPEALVLLYGAAVAAPLLLFGLLIWSGLERRFEGAALQHRMRQRPAGRGAAPAMALAFAVPAPPLPQVAVARQRDAA